VILSAAKKIYLGTSEVVKVYLGGAEVWPGISGSSFSYLELSTDFETQYALSGLNPLWQYTSLKGGL
jgi:hypothetical protein